jgi:hypothetical protein
MKSKLTPLFFAALLLNVLPGTGCDRPKQSKNTLRAPKNMAGHNEGGEADGIDAAARRKLLFAQIVEDLQPGEFAESGIIEGQPFKHFLKGLADVTHDQVRKQTNEQLQFETLYNEPGLYRGQVVTLPRAVILEVSQARLGPEYGLPGYTVLPAVAVDSLRDVYALRILCPPNSKLFEKLKKGIDEDALPVVRITGYFMKLYARQTADPEEPPWLRPLLVCPEPEFSQAAEPRSVWNELRDTKMDRLLPSQRIDTPGAEERLIVEMLPGNDTKNARVRIGNEDAPADLKTFIAAATAALKKRLPGEQREFPAAVIFINSRAPLGNLNAIQSALRAAGIKRQAVKREK